MKTKILLTLLCLFWQALAWGQATLVKDIYPLDGSGVYNQMFQRNVTGVIGNTLYFRADESINGQELWKSDGTEQGTVLVKDIAQGDRYASSYPNSFFSHKGNIYFSIFPSGLWRSNGTLEGTYKIWDEGYQDAEVPRFTIDTTLYILTDKYGLIIKNLAGLGFKVILDNKLSDDIYDDGYSSSPTYGTQTNQICKLSNKWIFSGRKKDFRTWSLFISNTG
ncbi:ELWxxDGT repeat protein [Runella sp.]|uniref:ELWxxDGT repeat protein n=1 Tax=Runella sp. TaxID=1960881 RepID=UPI00260D81A1|nr:ELWxxDGT repeat protein [Runella sp.]